MAASAFEPPAGAGQAGGAAMSEPLRGLQGYRPEIEPQVFAFQRQAYPERDPGLIPDRWRWMFLDSAAVHGVEPLVWTYFRKGELVAHQGAIPVRCKIGDAEHATSWFVETMVLEPARGGPVGATLVAKALADEPFNLSLGQSPVMRELQYRLGWKKIADLNTYAFTVDPREAFAQRPAVARLGLRAACTAWNAVSALRRAPAARAGLELAPVAGFDDRHSALWDRIAAHYTCAVRRDARFLNWKFVRQPGQVFERYEVRDGAQPRGLMALRVRGPSGEYRYRRLEITELLAAPADRAAIFALLGQAVARARALGVPLAYLHLHHGVLEASVRAFGFIRRPATRWLLLATASLPEAERRLAEDPGSWLLTGSDSDIDRP